MKNPFIVRPTGLKGNEKLDRMRELMGASQLNEDVKNSVVELTKIGPDGKVYGIVREGHNYFIKVTDKQSDIIAEDFNYIGGLMNKTSEAYPSYAKAIKQLNLKFMSLNEAYGKQGNYNVFEDDNLLTEHHPYKADQALSATKGMGDGAEYIVDKAGDELSYDSKEGKEDSQFGDNLAEKDVDNEFEAVKLSENEMAIEEMLVGESEIKLYTESEIEEGKKKKNPWAICTASVGKKNKEGKYYIPKDKEDEFKSCKEKVEVNESKTKFSISKAIDLMEDIVDENYKISEILNSLTESEKESLLDALKKSLTETKSDGMSTGLFADEEDGYNLEEEVKYKLKVAAPSTPPLPISDTPEVGGEEDVNIDLSEPEDKKSDKPFDDTPFDAGVEANEDEDPEKYIQQLAGKLGTTLRKYTEDKGEPDFDLEKFAVNSVISATHTGEMDDEDQKDIIKKIKSSGNDEKDVNVDVNVDTGDGGDNKDEKSDSKDINIDSEEKLDEAGDVNFDSGDKGFVKGVENQVWESDDLLNDAFGSDVEGIMEENHELSELKHNMFFNDVFSIFQSSSELLEMDDNTVDALLSDGHGWALDHIATANSQLESVYHFLEGSEAAIQEDGESNNYMFFQNLKNMRHASHEILNMDVYSIDEMLCHHEWMLNLIARANDDIEEVYHFLMGALDGYNEEEYEEWSQPMELTIDTPVSDELGYHLDNSIALGESIFRYGSDKFFSLLKEVKSLYDKGSIKLNENDAFIVNDSNNLYIKLGDDKFKMDFIFESVEDDGVLNEAEYQGKKVEIGKPKRGGSKKFYVYVKNPKTGKVKKVSFGAKAGGGNLAVKLRDPKARKAFADRHNCEKKNDKTKPGYWACRLPRYAKLLGLSGGGKWW